jgi:hypothetical protein
MKTENKNQPVNKRLKYTMCSNNSCCPVISEIENNKFIITDDYEGKVTITRDELLLLKNFLNENLKD